MARVIFLIDVTIPGTETAIQRFVFEEVRLESGPDVNAEILLAASYEARGVACDLVQKDSLESIPARQFRARVVQFQILP